MSQKYRIFHEKKFFTDYFAFNCISFTPEKWKNFRFISRNFALISFSIKCELFEIEEMRKFSKKKQINYDVKKLRMLSSQCREFRIFCAINCCSLIYFRTKNAIFCQKKKMRNKDENFRIFL